MAIDWIMAWVEQACTGLQKSLRHALQIRA